MTKVVLVLFIIFSGDAPPQSQRHDTPSLQVCLAMAARAFNEPPPQPNVSTYGAACIIEIVVGKDA